MTTLTDTQLVILSTAAQREDAGVILPERLKGSAAQKVVTRLLSLGLIEEVRAEGSLPVWRRDEEGAFALRITSAGLAAISAEPEPKEPNPELDGEADTQPFGGEAAAPALPRLMRTTDTYGFWSPRRGISGTPNELQPGTRPCPVEASHFRMTGCCGA